MLLKLSCAQMSSANFLMLSNLISRSKSRFAIIFITELHLSDYCSHTRVQKSFMIESLECILRILTLRKNRKAAGLMMKAAAARTWNCPELFHWRPASGPCETAPHPRPFRAVSWTCVRIWQLQHKGTNFMRKLRVQVSGKVNPERLGPLLITMKF